MTLEEEIALDSVRKAGAVLKRAASEVNSVIDRIRADPWASFKEWGLNTYIHASSEILYYAKFGTGAAKDLAEALHSKYSEDRRVVLLVTRR